MVVETARRATIGELLDGRDLSDEDREYLLVRAMDLCPECAATVRGMGQRMGGSMPKLLRRELWRFFNHWPHGNGCPSDAPR